MLVYVSSHVPQFATRTLLLIVAQPAVRPMWQHGMPDSSLRRGAFGAIVSAAAAAGCTAANATARRGTRAPGVDVTRSTPYGVWEQTGYRRAAAPGANGPCLLRHMDLPEPLAGSAWE